MIKKKKLKHGSIASFLKKPANMRNIFILCKRTLGDNVSFVY